MARPERHDADYFPFVCKDGRTLFILEGKYQCKGTGFFTNVMRFLTMQPDHHICLKKESERLYFISRTKCDEESAMDMLNLMATTGKIDQDLWEKYRVIVSQDLLNSLEGAYRLRKNTIITIDQIRVNYNNNPVTNDGNTDESELPTQSIHKGKDTKLKKNILCVYSNAFQSFWNAYPKHTAKKSAYQEWEKATTKPSLDVILSAIENQKRAKAAAKDTGQFTPEWPDPERWIKKARWDDEPESLRGSCNGNKIEKMGGVKISG